ncbi:MAG: YbhB/YbcL family Raf kinase inhibitor-like protein [Armatimonadota bacterium]|nr:YbhB/YbcL family Raf kinase inhibitor-like protein [bacterium]
MEVQVKSPAFSEGDSIPDKYTCNGDGMSPPIQWDVPGDNVQSFAVICEDPDAPTGVFTHWVVYDLPPDVHELSERVPNEDKLPNGGVHGVNSIHKTGYLGMCPPKGTHRYYFKVFALDKKLDLAPGAGKKKVEDAMQGHIVGEGELMGTYARNR